MTYTYFTDIFQYDPFPVEYECYKQLNGLNDINYIAVPWTQVLNSVWLDFPNKKSIDYYVNTLLNEKITQKNNFTVCQHDDYYKLTEIFRHLNITKVFSPLHNVNFNSEGIEYKPIAFTNKFTFDQKQKDILFSFVGAPSTHGIRQRMVKRINGNGIIYRGGYHIDSRVFTDPDFKKQEENEFKDILERSRYSLCPRGSSPSSVRFWESLAAGAIPILISDEWVLPEWNWKDTIIKISEPNFENITYSSIESYLKTISPEKEKMMRENCLKANEEFKKENFKSYILKNI